MGTMQTHEPGIARALVACGIRPGASATAMRPSLTNDSQRNHDGNGLSATSSERAAVI
ncbi:MAG: hypothetical protein U1E53_10280 [Dongiaceae bacterium]